MNRKPLIAFAAGALSAASLAVLIASAPAQPEEQDRDTGQEMSPENMMAEMAKLATPGEHHEILGKAVGQWDVKASFMTSPGAPPMETEGSMEVEWVLGKRFTKSTLEMDFMGQPFEGIAHTGYSNYHDRFVSTWMDTMTTNITYMTGNMDGDKLVMEGTSATPMGENPMRIVSQWEDDDTITDTFYDKVPGGEWAKSGTITYSRK